MIGIQLHSIDDTITTGKNQQKVLNNKSLQTEGKKGKKIKKITLWTDHFLAALVMNNAILIKNKNLIGCITSRAFFFGEYEITAIRRGTTSFVWGHTEVTVTSYSTF